MSLKPGKSLTDAEFEELCFSNDLIQFERTKDGEVIMHAPTASGTSDGNSEINAQLRAWWKTHRRGRVYDSNGGFYLHDGSMLSPDAAYVTPATLKGISKADLKHFLYRTPDFIIELLSASDRRAQAEAKMQSWIANGVQLAWLIDPYSKTVTVYSPDQEPVATAGPQVIGGRPVEGFQLDLNEVWSCYEV
jgi:Uma2 family endonuclease